jgi:hypothetical protein
MSSVCHVPTTKVRAVQVQPLDIHTKETQQVAPETLHCHETDNNNKMHTSNDNNIGKTGKHSTTIAGQCTGPVPALTTNKSPATAAGNGITKKSNSCGEQEPHKHTTTTKKSYMNSYMKIRRQGWGEQQPTQ